MRKGRIVSAIVMSVFVAATAVPAHASELSRLIKKDRPVKIFIDKVEDKSASPYVQAQEFRKELEKAFASRKSVSFEVVKDAASADAVVDCSIDKFIYLEHGPIKNYMGTAGLTLDAVASATQNFVEIAVSCTISDPRKEKVLWKDTVNPYIKHIMTPQESAPQIYDKAARAIVARSFGKQR